MKPTICFITIHDFILSRTKPYKFFHKQIKKNGVIEIENTDLDLFSFFSKTIISQQISFAVADKIWNDFQNKVDRFDFKGLSDKNKKVIKLLSELKISDRKKDTILRVNDLILKKELSHDHLNSLSETMLKKKLVRIKGVGPWTSDMMLIFFFKKLNVFPENDLVINKVKAKIEYLENCRINFADLFKPFLSILSLHFWKLSKRIL
jgi:3-methyladenine DNA glycosylase/8-oxoguanine DNA glycosylase